MCALLLLLLQAEISKVKTELDQFTSDPDKVSGVTDNLIENSRPTKTLDQLKKIRETGYYSESLLNISGMDDDDDDDVGGSTILKGMTTQPVRPHLLRVAPSSSPAVRVACCTMVPGRSVPTYKVRVKQRFDATHPDEMSLTLGDIFDVSEEIDENWAIAEVAGKRGMFPLNHVEKMIMLGASGSRF